jgi:septation ring formation regulator EzrA
LDLIEQVEAQIRDAERRVATQLQAVNRAKTQDERRKEESRLQLMNVDVTNLRSELADRKRRGAR